MSALAIDFKALMRKERARMRRVGGGGGGGGGRDDAGGRAMTRGAGPAPDNAAIHNVESNNIISAARNGVRREAIHGSNLSAARHGVKCFGGDDDDATVFYVPNFLSPGEEARLLSHTGGLPDSAWCAAGGRRLAHFGGVPHGSGMFPEERPAFIERVLGRLERFGCFAGKGLGKGLGKVGAPRPNHVLLNEYDPRRGGSIAPHKDGPLYEPTVAILSLQSPCLFEFLREREDKKKKKKKTVAAATGDAAAAADNDDDKEIIQSLLIMPRSLLVFRGAAYREYWHGIRARQAVHVRAEHVVAAGSPVGSSAGVFVCAEDFVPDANGGPTPAGDASSRPSLPSRMTFGEFFCSPLASSSSSSSSSRPSLPSPPAAPPISLRVDCDQIKRVSLTVRSVRSVKEGETLETDEFRQEIERRRRVFIHGVSDGRKN